MISSFIGAYTDTVKTMRQTERSEMIVIGNIYDNPELLKDGEQNE